MLDLTFDGVYLTGFQPFRDMPINPSWQCVKRLKATWTSPVPLTVAQWPVVYTKVPLVKAALVVHVGYSYKATCVSIERFGRSGPYVKPDEDGELPPICEPQTHKTAFDVDRMVSTIKGAGVPAEVSEDAGLYLCEYVYSRALVANEGRAIFVHVPKPEVLDESKISTAIGIIIREALQQLSTSDVT
ncbi:MAG: uncharacterized protein KVP18_004509 [Porospora cf. gigantea A]|uniref:uncharacterized protein n=1 Tax=Porospora cf. gigantea A TaxID=2853593 RepID=UPI003559B536|nr:MAG: hypothetical protein KVP18_004509 [Porospora cf. gigantea A]